MLRIVFISLLCFTYTTSVYLKRIEDICINETECEEYLETESSSESTGKEGGSANEERTTDNTNTTQSYNTTQLDIGITSTTPVPKIAIHKTTKNRTVSLRKSEICECDLTVSSCDINCCCDTDCKEFHLNVFSHCEDHHAELYDSRYCYNRNFIQRNNTPFILEKLANNLFCILYDNLPPTYSVTNDLVLKQHKDLKEAINAKKSSWRWEIQQMFSVYNISSSYEDGDLIWKFQKNYIKPLEVLQSGFTGLCSFKKKLKYLQEWKASCMQTELANTNAYLFHAAFDNFTVISSLLSFNESYIASSEELCPRNICLPLTSHYCAKSLWSSCNTTQVSGSCLDGICQNIIKGVKYVIAHNGSAGISSINVYFDIGNVSRSFYQHFEVIYEWVDLNKEKSFTLSGNPGYLTGKPIISGILHINKTGNTESRHINFTKTDSYLTLPLAQRNGECSNHTRYIVGFGEDIKLKCSVTLATDNFTATSCAKLQNDTMRFFMMNSLDDVTQADQYKIYVSKQGNFTENSTESWVQILLDRVPQNIITGQMINDQIRCSGLITSIHLDILYSVLSKPETLTNYNILGVGITFSEETDISWTKCTTPNCTDILKIDIVSFVTFHDISKPSKYYFVGGPNLDITLPYDFFYPFLSGSETIQLAPMLLCSTILIVYLNY